MVMFGLGLFVLGGGAGLFAGFLTVFQWASFYAKWLRHEAEG